MTGIKSVTGVKKQNKHIEKDDQYKICEDQSLKVGGHWFQAKLWSVDRSFLDNIRREMSERWTHCNGRKVILTDKKFMQE